MHKQCFGGGAICSQPVAVLRGRCGRSANLPEEHGVGPSQRPSSEAGGFAGSSPSTQVMSSLHGISC